MTDTTPTLTRHYIPTKPAGELWGQLDPITLYVEDWGPTSGRLVVHVWSKAWAAWWSATGARDVLAFVAECDRDYLAECLIRGRLEFISSKAAEKREFLHLLRVAGAVIDYAKAATS